MSTAHFWRRPAYALLPLFLSFLPHALAAELRVSLAPEGATATGASPGEAVAWMLTGRERDSGSEVLYGDSAVLPDEDGDGQVSWPLGGALPFQSAVVAVDVKSGAVALAGPVGFELQALPVPPEALVHGADGAVDAVRLSGRFLELLVVRPGVGAWALSGRDGGAEDADQASDGSVELPLAELEALGASPAPPSALAAGDVVVLLDRQSVTVVVSQLGAADLVPAAGAADPTLDPAEGKP